MCKPVFSLVVIVVATVPPNATVKVEFQGAHPIAAGSKEPDPDSPSEWTTRVHDLVHYQFLRYRLLFDLTADGSPLSAHSRRPAVQWLRIEAQF